MGTVEPSSWQLWCRLCASSNTEDNMSIFVKNEKKTYETGIAGTTEDTNQKILDAIAQYFPTSVELGEGLPKMLCQNCYNLMTSLMNFSEYVKRVHQMFNAIQQSCSESTGSSVTELRHIYKITNLYSGNVLIKLPLVEANQIETEPIINTPNDDNTCTNVNPLELLEINIGTKTETNFEEEENPMNNSDMENSIGSASNADEQCVEEHDNNTEQPLVKAPKKRKCSKNSVDAKAANEIFSCNECSWKGKRKSDLQNHMKYIHKIRPVHDYACNQCPRTFPTEHQLKKHTSTHFMCEKCGKTLKTEKSIQRHMLAHSDSSSLKCHICYEVFEYQFKLERHLQLQHSFKPTCTECGLKFSSKQTLKNHMVVHSDEKCHKCDYCGSAFKTSKTLKIHLLLHTGLKPYSCDFCELTFASGSNCRKHERTTHAQEYAASVASGGVKKKWHSKEIPNLKTLKEIVVKNKPFLPGSSTQSDDVS